MFSKFRFLDTGNSQLTNVIPTFFISTVTNASKVYINLNLKKYLCKRAFQDINRSCFRTQMILN
jgi:hypothetical protein